MTIVVAKLGAAEYNLCDDADNVMFFSELIKLHDRSFYMSINEVVFHASYIPPPMDGYRVKG